MSQRPKAYVLRLGKELRNLKREPLPNIWVEPLADDITHMIALILGPNGTPYQNGFFLFDMKFTDSYPFEPPHVQLLTTDRGKVRFNPNLYSNGKVCLSILGTWSGPKWTSAESVASVLLSIQSLMCEKPYHNEPGYEKERSPGAVDNYNKHIFHENLRVAVCGVCENIRPTDPSFCFRHIIQAQYLLWFESYIASCDSKLELDGKPFQDPFGQARGTFEYAKIKTRLRAIKEKFHQHYPISISSTSATSPEAMDTFDPTTVVDSNLQSVLNSQGLQSPKDRITKEAASLRDTNLEGVSAGPREENLFIWDVTLFLEDGGLLGLALLFPDAYPLAPPVLMFTQAMFHPNVSPSGIVCLDCLSSAWAPDITVEGILVSLQSALESPNLASTVNPEACKLYCEDLEAFKRKFRRLCQM